MRKTIDEKIKPIVELLQQNSYKTIGSCQGGPGHPSKNPFVSVEGTDRRIDEEISELLSKHGLEHTVSFYGPTYVHNPDPWPNGFYVIRFTTETIEKWSEK